MNQSRYVSNPCIAFLEDRHITFRFSCQDTCIEREFISRFKAQPENHKMRRTFRAKGAALWTILLQLYIQLHDTPFVMNEIVETK